MQSMCLCFFYITCRESQFLTVLKESYRPAQLAQPCPFQALSSSTIKSWAASQTFPYVISNIFSVIRFQILKFRKSLDIRGFQNRPLVVRFVTVNSMLSSIGTTCASKWTPRILSVGVVSNQLPNNYI